MMKSSSKDRKSTGEKEAENRADEVLKRMLNTPPPKKRKEEKKKPAK